LLGASFTPSPSSFRSLSDPMIDPVCFRAVSVPCHMYESGASTLTCVSRSTGRPLRAAVFLIASCVAEQ
jgi:hypothetical protein